MPKAKRDILEIVSLVIGIALLISIVLSFFPLFYTSKPFLFVSSGIWFLVSIFSLNKLWDSGKGLHVIRDLWYSSKIKFIVDIISVFICLFFGFLYLVTAIKL
jgi:hypothetical protein